MDDTYHSDDLKYVLEQAFRHYKSYFAGNIQPDGYFEAEGIEFKFLWKIDDQAYGKRTVCNLPNFDPRAIRTTNLDVAISEFDDFDLDTARSVRFTKLTHLGVSKQYEAYLQASSDASFSSGTVPSGVVTPTDRSSEGKGSDRAEAGGGDQEMEAAGGQIEMADANADDANRAEWDVFARIAKFTANSFDGCKMIWFKFSIQWPKINKRLTIEKRFKFKFHPLTDQKLIVYKKMAPAED